MCAMLNVTPLPYTLHFKRPAATSRGELRVRQVVFLRAERDGAVGWGECGVVPGLSFDDRVGYVDTIGEVCARINRGLDLAELNLAALPSVVFGLETALMDLASDGRQRLFDTAFSRGESSLPTHGLIWMDTPAGVLAQVEQKIARGCRVIKMKVGGLPFDEECALLATLRDRYPAGDVELRLDANGAFAPSEALERLIQLAEFDVAFLEQPIPAGDRPALAGLCARSPIPIALDEELIGIGDSESRRKLLDTIRPQHVILKPSLLGGLAACEAWIDEAERAGCQWWINSLLESNVGLNAICQWTSALDATRVHGLGTGQLFANNLPSPLQIAGCGLQMNPAASWDFGTLLG